MNTLTNKEIAFLFQLFLNREWAKAVEWWMPRGKTESIHNLGILFESAARDAASCDNWAESAIRLYCLAGFSWELAWWLNETPGIKTIQIAARCYGEASSIFERVSGKVEFEEGPEVKKKLRNMLS